MDSLKILERLMKDGASERDRVRYLADNVPLTALARDDYNLYQKSDKQTGFTPMRISQSDFDNHFRIIGFKSDGTKEQRGANRWKKEE